MSILNEDLSNVDIRNPLIPDGTIVEVVIDKEEASPTKSGNGEMFVVEASLTEPVESDLQNSMGQPVMINKKTLRYSEWCGEKDRNGFDGTQRFAGASTYKEDYQKKLKKYGAAFEGSSFEGSLADFARVGLTAKARVSVRETETGGKFNEISGWLPAQ